MCVESAAHCAANKLFGALPPPPCTARGSDVYRTGARVPCCGADVACVKPWNPLAPNDWFWLCVKSHAHCEARLVDGDIPVPSSCTLRGADPFATGSNITCCGSDVACLKPWNPLAPSNWFYKCVESQAHCNATLVQGEICTGLGADPSATGQLVSCCQQFWRCSRNWTADVM